MNAPAGKVFALPVSDCGCFFAGELGPDIFTPDVPRFGVVVFYESKDVAKKAGQAAIDAHWSGRPPDLATQLQPILDAASKTKEAGE